MRKLDELQSVFWKRKGEGRKKLEGDSTGGWEDNWYFSIEFNFCFLGL